MEAPAPATSQQMAPPNHGPQPDRQRGGRRVRAQGRGGASLSFRPSSVAPVTQQGPAEASSAEGSAAESRQTNRNRRGRGGRPPQNRTVNGRQFGGQLTHEDSSASRDTNQLQGGAQVFVPGQAPSSATQSTTQQRQAPKQPRPKQRRLSKSQAPDIATRTHEDIDNGYYECPICTSEVQRKSKVWSCHTCWTVFHLSCIKKWSTNEGSAAAQQHLQGAEAPPRQWRCPGCNLPKDELPKAYNCWCGKEYEPRAPAGLPPHSCGQTCGKERAKKCPHPCQLTCHAGPCPPCTHMGPTQMCFCGKHEVTKRCSETDYDNGWSCGEICGEVMPCGEHTHRDKCHEGLCGPCEFRVPARCYCGEVEKEVLCDDRGSEKESQRIHASEDGMAVTEKWTGTFDCGNNCNRLFDCAIHRCELECHQQDAEPGHCPRSPDMVIHCSCGKTPLRELTNRVRETCEDPIPSCLQPCGKPLACGHTCEQVCHIGSCASCMKTVDIKCRCGRTTSRTICHQGKEEPPQCMRVCRTTLNCGRHACDERCCSGERHAAERQSVRRKQRPLSSASRPVNDGFEAEHICTRQCGRLLKCGTHVCEELCHKGPCGTCREAIFEEISCHCGRTVLHPPLPCGTKPPPCRSPCNRPKTCGHPQVPHNCHQDDEACPKCPFLIEKRCMCGKKTLKNQQCWLQDVRCGMICDKKLRCGSHHCRKQCHKPGECEDMDGQQCQQPCGKEKKVCGHPDYENLCHAPYPCKEDKPCQSKMYITCSCQAQKQEMKCGASKTSEGNNGKSLPCNEECARLERNRKLAVALNIDQSLHVDGGDHLPYSAETLNLFAQNVKWGQTQEREFRVFATSDDEKRLRFKPMRPHERAFIHALAEDFGLDSESMDPEPHRHAMIWKTPRFVSPPNKTLAEALRIRSAHRSTTASANVSDTEGAAQKVKASNEVGEPYNSFVISNPRFGLTVEDLRSETTSLMHQGLALTFDIEFLPSGEVVLKAVSRTLSSYDLQQTLQTLRASLVTAVAAKGYGMIQLCSTDSSLNILRRESDSSSTDGWSRVAAKKAAPKFVMQGSGFGGGNNSFAALTGSKVTFAKKKPEKIKPRREAIVEDWEAAELAEEEKEKGTSGEEDAGIGEESTTDNNVLEATGSNTDVGVDSADTGRVPSEAPDASTEADVKAVGSLDRASQVEEAST